MSAYKAEPAVVTMAASSLVEPECSRVRAAGDGASNMRGEFNGLRALIMRENSSAYYVHYFAHQLQLVIVASTSHCGSS